MTHRFYCEQPIEGKRATLVGSEAHHLLHVMRLTAGDHVKLFDGSGFEFSANILETRRAEVELEVVERTAVDHELPFRLTVGVALPKGDRQRWLVEKLVELGVERIVPLETERGVAQPTIKALARLRRSVIEATKQCGRNRLAEVSPAERLHDYLVSAPADAYLLAAHPGGVSLNRVLTLPAGKYSQDFFLVIGPEGGLTELEVADATNAGWRLIDLGPRILRIETAAVALVAAIGAMVIEF